jgi:Ca2+-binding RTX toxin-like protein
MALYNLDQFTTLMTPNIDPAVQQQVISVLMADGFLPPSVPVQIGGYPPLDPTAAVLDLTTQTNVVTTDAALDVILQNTDANLTVLGVNDVVVADSIGDDSITLNDFGDDSVFLSGGFDTVTLGFGSDTVYGAASSVDSLAGGAGDFQQILGGDNSQDTLRAGSGDADSIIGGAGSRDSISAGSGNDQLVQGGGGSRDTIRGGSGDGDTVMGGMGDRDSLIGGTGTNQLIVGQGSDTIFAGVGGDTINGSGNDQIHIGTNHGNDTINGGAAGNDVVYFDTRDAADAHISTSGAVTTVSFTDGQAVQITGVTADLHFHDQTKPI